jgi:hypothetical protein
MKSHIPNFLELMAKGEPPPDQGELTGTPTTVFVSATISPSEIEKR